jgi:hypothetical protein
MSSVIFAVPSNGDKALILDTKASLLQQFKAQNWTDLRLTMALSLTSQSANDQQSGLAETLGTAGDTNHAYIGFKSSDGLLPPSTNFWGISTNQILAPSAFASLIDQGPGIFFQLSNSNSPSFGALLSNGTTKVNNNIGTGNGPRFYEGASPGTLYATLISLRMRRTDPTLSSVATLEVLQNIIGGPIDNQGAGSPVFVSDTTVPTLRAITAAATFTQLLGPFTFTSVPDAIYAYVPFNNSRLRIHSYVLEKYA